MERGECEETWTETNRLSPAACKHKSEAVHLIIKHLSNYYNTKSVHLVEPGDDVAPTLLVSCGVFLVFISHVRSSQSVILVPSSASI